MTAKAHESGGYVIITFPKGATITKELWRRLFDNKFYKQGRTMDYVALPHKTEADLWLEVAETIAEDFNKGRYSKEMLYPKKAA